MSEFRETAESVLRSLVGGRAFEAYTKTGLYNTGQTQLDNIVKMLFARGSLGDVLHDALKKRLTSIEMNVELDALPGAVRHGRLVALPGGLL